MYNREKEWNEFSEKVKNHIISYTIPQWGDYPQDQITNWSVESCLDQIKKYLNRYGKNSREGQEELDFFKAAHIICVAYFKYLNGNIEQEEMITITKKEYEELKAKCLIK